MSCGSGFVGVHMGAGYHSPINWDTYNAVCRSACKKAIEVLKSTNNALKAIVAATVYLENSQWSNAGFGSNLTLTGKVECDASIMDGNSLLFGSVGAVSGVKNPIALAENILVHQMRGEMSLGRIPPCMLVGEGAHRWAVGNGVEVVNNEDLISENARKSYNKNKRKLEYHDTLCEFESMPNKKSKLESEDELINNHQADDIALCEIEISNDGRGSTEKKLDTIGVVCMDGEGRVASTVSSGGIILKQPGRVGQAGLYGCGCWAENEADGRGVAATTSGCGEHLMKTFLAKECAETIKNCEEPVQSLVTCFQNKFIGSPFLRSVREPMGGALTLKTSTNDDEEKLNVEFQWIHTTESFSLGFMSTEDAQPWAFVSTLPKEHAVGKTITAGNHCCTIPISKTSNLNIS